MSIPMRGKLINLLTTVMLLIGWGGLRLILVSGVYEPDGFMILVDVPIWLCIGALMRNSIYTRVTRERLLGLADITRAVLLGWFTFGILWVLPAWFPGLSTGSYGIELNLHRSPLFLTVSLAFITGFYAQVITKIFPTVLIIFRQRWQDFSKCIFRGVLWMTGRK